MRSIVPERLARLRASTSISEGHSPILIEARLLVTFSATSSPILIFCNLFDATAIDAFAASTARVLKSPMSERRSAPLI